MNKDLTNSVIVRQNVLNNMYAVEEIQKAVGVKGILFEQSYRFVKKQLADFSRRDRTYHRELFREERQGTTAKWLLSIEG